MRTLRWSADEARAAVALPGLHRRLGTVAGVPAVVVEPDGASLQAEATALARLPVVTVTTGEVARADDDAPWDVVTDNPEPVLDGILAAPLAAVTAAQVLRGAADRTVDEGLNVESWAYASLQAGPEFTAWLEWRGRRVRPVDPTPRLRVDDHGHRVDVVLTRARLRNLLDTAMRDQLVDTFEALALGPDRPVVWRAEGPAFCAGGDPAEFGTVGDPAHAHAIRSAANVAPWPDRIADRVTADIDGACVGAGVELAAFCGRVRATQRARFRLPETRMGLLPGAGGTVSIPRRIGRQRTLEWLLTGEEVDVPTARAWGLVDEVVAD